VKIAVGCCSADQGIIHNMKANRTAWLMLIISTFFWGSNFNVAQVLAGPVQPLTAAAARFSIALVIFLLLRLWQGKAESQLQWVDALVLVPLGLIGVFGFNFAFFTAMHTTIALNAALIMALSPMLSLLLSSWLLNTSISANQVVGIIVAFVGVSLVITGGDFTTLHIAVGDIWMLGACLVWSVYTVGSRRFANHIPPQQFARWTVSIGAVALVIAAAIQETPFSSITQLSLATHGILLYMGSCGTVLAYVFWVHGVQHLGPDKTAVSFNLVPLFTLLVSIATGTLPNTAQMLGIAVVLLGVLINTGWVRLRRQPRVPASAVCKG
jgi:drug/metabolite transporter (DMT)-like permease